MKYLQFNPGKRDYKILLTFYLHICSLFIFLCFFFFCIPCTECWIPAVISHKISNSTSSIIRKLSWNRLTHYFRLGLPLSQIREISGNSFHRQRGRKEEKLLIPKTSHYPLPGTVKLNYLRERKNPNVMLTKLPLSALLTAVRRNLRFVEFLTNPIPPFIRKYGLIVIVHHPIAKHVARRSCLIDLVPERLKTSIR